MSDCALRFPAIAHKDAFDGRPADELRLRPTGRRRESLHVEIRFDPHLVPGVDDFPFADAQSDVAPMLDLIPNGTGTRVEHKRSDRWFAAILRRAIFIG